MIWPRQAEEFEKLMMNEFTGIGIEISKPKGRLTIASLLEAYAGRSGGSGMPEMSSRLLTASRRRT